MVPNRIWAPDFFGPQEIWSPRSMIPEKYGFQEIRAPHENHHMAFSCGVQISWGPNFSGPKFLGANIAWGPNLSGPKKVRDPNEIGAHFSLEMGCLHEVSGGSLGATT
jgi:hypothetical protein